MGLEVVIALFAGLVVGYSIAKILEKDKELSGWNKLENKDWVKKK